MIHLPPGLWLIKPQDVDQIGLKKKKNHDKIILLAKSKLNSVEVLIFKVLIDSDISHDEFILINNVLKEHNDMKQGTKSLTT